ncbi:MAG: hypothetical protein QY323_01340 [Patescibacteria group bacterium]|nr:MAG: hypothetical protein QY323_01340 [Patescibacteria group bacterium]
MSNINIEDKDTKGGADAPVDKLGQIRALLFVCKEPEMLLEAFQPEYDQNAIDDVLLRKYQEMLSSIGYARDKVLRYPVFFESFYPDISSGIAFDESFNHHVHAYLQDMDTLKNKLETYVDHARKDVSAVATNSDDVSAYYRALKQEIGSSFEGTSEHRNPHVHHGPRFMDGAALRAENARKGREIFGSIFPNANPDRVAEFHREQEEEERNASAEAKAHWIAMAQRNNEKVTGLVDTVVTASANHLFHLLGMEEMVVKLKEMNPGITL